ncbi:UDP-N-acetylglucosamine transferase subunit ALG13-like protein [Frankliniella fusca]|uniref:UDP-N-acetylglucosamine transferase subunit ALG13 n=1 Tax=Frankliniella fusca TaxID=407009 RepID=A0AAE1H849_9NEOP|nr:UDP-N-acetylglucosamine transferase subunit ALG13-like protein [Frankliniella fusca]
MATSGGHVFATVGTTKFDLFIRTLTNDDVLRELARRGYSSLTVQFGDGLFEPKSGMREGIKVECYRFKDSIVKDIKDADLVISHAGAGTCLEVLERNKKLIVVINEELMDNHQTELADKLFKENHVFCCTPASLCRLIQSMDFTHIRPFPPGETLTIAKFLDEVCGFGSTPPTQ